MDSLELRVNQAGLDDFFTVEVLSWRGLVTYSVLFFLYLKAAGSVWRESPDIRIKSGWNSSPAPRPRRPGDIWMGGVMFGTIVTRALPARSPNLNAFAERWIRSPKEECPSKLILFGEGPLSRTLAEFSAQYHGERNHQGKGNKLPFPDAADKTEQRGCFSEGVFLL